MRYDFDCLIVGGGLVGASLATALRDLPIRIGVVEAVPVTADQQPSYDDRGLGIAPASQRILQAIGCWEALAKEATPIREIHVSDRGHFGTTRISAKKLGIDQLGHIVIGRALGKVLQNAIMTAENTEFICPGTIVSIENRPDHIHVVIQEGEKTRTASIRLLIAADGGQSRVREMLGVKTETKDYGQTAIVTNVTPELDHNHTAFERFTTSGPLALLPSTEGRCVVVWTAETDCAQKIMQLEESDFLNRLGDRFGHRLGNFIKMGTRRSYPMRLIRAKNLVGLRFAIIGNAAHTIHPNAAQGLNLGLRDVACMAELIADAVRRGKDLASPDLLNTYSDTRQRDHQQVIRFSDGLTKLFYNDNPLLIAMRGLAMLGVDLIPPAKRALVRRAMGLAGNCSRLIRGLPL